MINPDCILQDYSRPDRKDNSTNFHGFCTYNVIFFFMEHTVSLIEENKKQFAHERERERGKIRKESFAWPNSADKTKPSLQCKAYFSPLLANPTTVPLTFQAYISLACVLFQQ